MHIAKSETGLCIPSKAYIAFVVLTVSEDLLTPIAPGDLMIESARKVNK